MPNFDFAVDPNNLEGSLTELMDYLKWFNNHLDDVNLKYFAWGDSIVDNVDATHKLKLKFYVPDGVLKVNKLTLNFSVEAFRAYETGAASGGGSTATSSSGGGTTATSSSGGGTLVTATTGNTYAAGSQGTYKTGNELVAGGTIIGGLSNIQTSADGSHNHTIDFSGHDHEYYDDGVLQRTAIGQVVSGKPTSSDGEHSHTLYSHNHYITHEHDVSIPDHSHDVTIPSHTHSVDVPAHTHDITYGIYESTAAAGCKVYVDGTLRLDNGGAGYDADQANLDLTQWVQTAGWHYIEISSSQLGRINAAYFMQVYVGASGI